MNEPLLFNVLIYEVKHVCEDPTMASGGMAQND
jgi:hypothetical protein